MTVNEAIESLNYMDVGTKKVSKEGMTQQKNESISKWYNELIIKAKLISYYSVTGFYILLPNSYAIWEIIQKLVDKNLKDLGMSNCYFPLVVTEENMKKESAHLDDFSPELAYLNVVEHTESENVNRIALRATSEAVIYPTMKKMINSHRDLPLKLNQWCNICRLESKQCWPFIRTREFLWHEGHTAHANEKEAIEFAQIIGDLYVKILRDYMALPCIMGKKTDAEKFAGSCHSITCEVFIPENGRSIQATTSHYLAQNFSKMFDIKYLNPDNHEEFFHVFQTCFAITTRSIGIIIMVHGDDKGLVLPPHIAPIQCIIVPCGIKAKSTEQEISLILSKCRSIDEILKSSNLRSCVDERMHVTPGVKFNQYELEGIPLRIEIGPNDLKKNQVTLCRRFDGKKLNISQENIIDQINSNIQDIHIKMLNSASEKSKDVTTTVKTWNEFCDALSQNKIIFAPFCGKNDCENAIRHKSKLAVSKNSDLMGAKSLVIPSDYDHNDIKLRCIFDECGSDAKYMCYFGRSY